MKEEHLGRGDEAQEGIEPLKSRSDVEEEKVKAKDVRNDSITSVKVKLNYKHMFITALISMVFVIGSAIGICFYFYPDWTLNTVKSSVGWEEKKGIEGLVKIHPDREAVLRYMHKHSNVSASYLSEIYDEVKNDPQKLLLLAMMKKESHYNPFAASKVAVGLMQIHKINFKLCGEQGFIPMEKGKPVKRELYDIGNNIACGKYILNDYLERADNNIHLALRHYVLGPNAKKDRKTTYPDDVLKNLGELYLIAELELHNHNKDEKLPILQTANK